MWTILSGMFGGLLRLVPELIKYLDSKNERQHELDMQDKAYKFEELRGKQKLEEVHAQELSDWNRGAVESLKVAIEEQGKSSGVLWIDGFSKLMRPLITFQWVVILYPAVIIASFVIMLRSGLPVGDAISKSFGDSEKALVSFVVDFWFVGRILDRGRNAK